MPPCSRTPGRAPCCAQGGALSISDVSPDAWKAGAGPRADLDLRSPPTAPRRHRSAAGRQALPPCLRVPESSGGQLRGRISRSAELNRRGGGVGFCFGGDLMSGDGRFFWTSLWNLARRLAASPGEGVTKSGDSLVTAAAPTLVVTEGAGVGDRQALISG